jgi:hypothetical protein
MEHEEDTKDTKSDHSKYEADEHGHINANKDTGDQEKQQPAQSEGRHQPPVGVASLPHKRTRQALPPPFPKCGVTRSWRVINSQIALLSLGNETLGFALV